MGYVRDKTFRLTWDDDTEFAGLEVRAKSLSIDNFLRVAPLMELAGKDRDGFSADDMAQIDEIFTVFAGALVDWNLEQEDGTPVPATREGLGRQDLAFGLAVAMQWLKTVVAVSPDLGKDLPSGETFPEESGLPMEPLSTSPPS